MRRVPRILLLLLLPLFVNAGCNDPAEPTVARVEIDSSAARLNVGDTMRLTARVYDAGGQPITRAVRWSSSNSAVLAVDPSGRANALAVGTAVITATADGVTSPPLQVRVIDLRSLSCSSEGTAHPQARKEVWRRVDSPHVLDGRVEVIDTLRIEPGTLVCALPGSSLETQGGAILALGTARDPIRFTASDPARGWGAIASVLTDTRSRFRHIRVEYASRIGFYGGMDIDSAVFRQMALQAVWLLAGRLANSVVDTSGNSFGGAAVHIELGGTIENVLVRDARADGVSVNGGPARLLGVRVDGFQGRGLVALGQVVEARPVRITRGAAGRVDAGIAMMPVSNFQVIYPREIDQDSLLGNAVRQLVISGRVQGEFIMRGEFEWVAAAPPRSPVGTILAPLVVDTAGVLRARAGASFRSNGLTQIHGRLLAEGTADRPIALSGNLDFLGSPSTSSRLTHVRLQRAVINALENHVLELERISTATAPFGFTAIALRSARSSLTNSVLDSIGFTSATLKLPALIIAGQNVRVENTMIRWSQDVGVLTEAANVTMRTCEVSNSRGIGVRVGVAEGVVINNCNFVDNGGVGVESHTATVLNARFNWWGSISGPNGPGGDGIVGRLDTSGFLITPVVIPALPAALKRR